MKEPVEKSEEGHSSACRLSVFINRTVNSDLECAFGSWLVHLDEERSREQNVTGPLHLVSLDRPVHALARRAIVFREPTLHYPSDVSQYARVSHYYKALTLLCHHVSAAMQAGKITPRDDVLGAPRELPEVPVFTAWHQLSGAVQAYDFATVATLLSEPFANLTDSLFPSVMVDLTEFSRWAVTDGIAAAGEVERLLTLKAGDASSSNCLPGKPSAESKDALWKTKAKQYANEIWRRDKAIGCDPSRLDVASAIAKRFADEGISGARFQLSAETIVRHGLKGWQKPP